MSQFFRIPTVINHVKTILTPYVVGFHVLEEKVIVQSRSVQIFTVFCVRCTTEVLRTK